MPVVELVKVDVGIASSYDRNGRTGGPRSGLRPLADLKAGVATPATAAAMKRLADAVTAEGGDFRVTESHRDIVVQRTARNRYDNWVRAGKPKQGTAGFNASTMKAAYVATPGRSMHNAGRAIDVDIASLKFPGVAADKQLDKLWTLAKAVGWSPIIKSADERASEAWHFDCYDDLAPMLRRVGYEQTALCGAILVGHGDLTGFVPEIQALLCRAGFDIGGIDGVVGPRTKRSLAAALNVTDVVVNKILATSDTSVFPKLLELETA
jgi:hypothetical protein